MWNYETGKVELVKKYLVDVSVVALHPSGLLICVGFLDNMQLKEIMLNDLKVSDSVTIEAAKIFNKFCASDRVSKHSTFRNAEMQCFLIKDIC